MPLMTEEQKEAFILRHTSRAGVTAAALVDGTWTVSHPMADAEFPDALFDDTTPDMLARKVVQELHKALNASQGR